MIKILDKTVETYERIGNTIIFNFEGKEYKYTPYEYLEDSDLPYNYQTNKKDKMKYLDYGCGFDIETTKINPECIIEASEDKTFSTMYMWQFAIDDLTVIGRTWEEFIEFKARLSQRLHLTDKRRLLVWIHNEKFEFSFIKNRFTWAEKEVKEYDKKNNRWYTVDTRPDIFSLDDRTVIKAVTAEGIEFRDSYVLTQRSLAKLAKDFNLDIKKLDDVGFDYDLAMHNETPLQLKQLAYGINDVQILAKFYHSYIKPVFIDKGFKIPLTATGIVRDDLKRTFKNLPKAEKEKYKKFIHTCFPSDKAIYDYMLNKLYRGGYTHANIKAVNILFDYFDDLSSWDYKSSYPAVLLHNKYPYKFKAVSKSKFIKIMKGNYKRYFKDNAIWGTFRIKDIYNKTSLSLDSENKLISYSSDAAFDNGRLLSASEVIVALTEQDILNYLEFYTIDDINQWECLELHESKKEYLPKFFRDMILKYYYEKEEAGKNKKEDPISYAIAKAKLNSLYGMLVTAVVQQDTRFFKEVGIIGNGNATKSYDNAIDGTILLPQWGIWCTAYARRNLVHTMITKLKDDVLYGDTDSAKIKNTAGNKHVFDEYNDRMRRINKTMYVGKYPREVFKNLGCFDYEGRIVKLKTLGCKRYLHTEVEKDKKTGLYKQVTNATVSGLIKGSLQDFCELNDLDIYETFDSDLDINNKIVFELDKDVSKKKTAVYFDKPFKASLTDYEGNTIIVSELSGCSIIDIPFKMSMNEEFINLILYMGDNKKKKGRAY